MNKMSLILKYEFLSVVNRRSYILTLILVPLITFIVLMVINVIKQSNSGPDIVQTIFAPPQEEVQGVVDQSGIIKMIPDEYQNKLLFYENTALANQAMLDQEISSYFVILPDYLETGDIEYYRQDFNPIGGASLSNDLNTLLEINLLNGDQSLAGKVAAPMDLETIYLSDQPERSPDDVMTFMLPYMVTMLFYMFIMGASSLMLNSISNEKQNRILEILLTSAKPIELMTGKIIALALVGLLQTVFWSISGYLLLQLAGQTFVLPSAASLSPTILIWGVIFFLLGYFIYASLLAGIGALIPNIRENSQLTTLVFIPQIIPLLFISVLITRPNSTISLILSLFPFTAPVSMMTRLSATVVPAWQIIVSIALMVATAYLVIQGSARLFNAQHMLSGQQVKVKTYFKLLFQRER